MMVKVGFGSQPDTIERTSGSNPTRKYKRLHRLDKKSAPLNINGALMLAVYLPQLKLSVNLWTLFRILIWVNE